MLVIIENMVIIINNNDEIMNNGEIIEYTLSIIYVQSNSEKVIRCSKIEID